ncbi:MAG: calcium-binding protein [Micropruina sp.]|nr:calcium-binding protein [Micropruina sp.]
MIFGDYGRVLQNVVDPNLPDIRLQKIQTTEIGTILEICAVNVQQGGDDIIYGSEFDDVLIGGAGNDMIDGLGGGDLIFGDNACIYCSDGTSFRFQTLSGGILYSRSDRPATGGTADTSGQLLVDGVARLYRDPDDAPWWSKYSLDFLGLHTFAVEDGLAGVGTFGNDYLAGGAGHDMIFGQLGNDIVQGDGSIVDAHAAISHVGASRSPDGCVATSTGGDSPTHAGTCDLVGDLDQVSSFDGTADGQDYIEGNGGNDIVFGNLGQDDIVGGSSDFFGLNTPDLRPGRRRPAVRRIGPELGPQRQRRRGPRCGAADQPAHRRRGHHDRRQRPDHPDRRHQRPGRLRQRRLHRQRGPLRLLRVRRRLRHAAARRPWRPPARLHPRWSGLPSRPIQPEPGRHLPHRWRRDGDRLQRLLRDRQPERTQPGRLVRLVGDLRQRRGPRRTPGRHHLPRWRSGRGLR